MREQANELWQIVSIRPFGDQPKGIEHVAYKSTKESADEYVEWLSDERYNRGKVKSVTQYLQADKLPQWIHIDQQLPELYQVVLFTCFYDDDNHPYWQEINIGQYLGGKTLGGAIAIETYGDDWYPCTHWMPLPQPPEIPK